MKSHNVENNSIEALDNNLAWRYTLTMMIELTKGDEMKLITAAEIIYLRRHNHVACVYPRKHEVHDDGHKRYRITDRELAALKQANNGLAN